MKSYTTVTALQTTHIRHPFRLPNQRWAGKPDDPQAWLTFEAVIRPQDADFALEFSELADLAASDGNVDLMSPEGVAFVARFFKLMIGPQYRAFKSAVAGVNGEVLGDIISDLSVLATEVAEEASDRPLERPASSSAGRARPKAGRASQLMSLAGSDVELVLVSGDGESEVLDPTTVVPPAVKRQQRRKQTRRAS